MNSSLARRSLARMFKRCPSLVSKFVTILAHKLCDRKTPEHVVLGSCKLLSDATVIKHLNTVHLFQNFIELLWLFQMIVNFM